MKKVKSTTVGEEAEKGQRKKGNAAKEKEQDNRGHAVRTLVSAAKKIISASAHVGEGEEGDDYYFRH